MSVGVLLAVFTACGNGTGGEASNEGAPTTTAASEGGDAGEAGTAVDPAPPGQAVASIDGMTVTLDTIDPEGCEISDTEAFFSFSTSANEIERATGSAFLMDGDWSVSFLVTLEGSDAAGIQYNPISADEGGGGVLTVDGNGLTYSGEWEAFRQNEGRYESVGNGTLSVTCS